MSVQVSYSFLAEQKYFVALSFHFREIPSSLPRRIDMILLVQVLSPIYTLRSHNV